MAIPPIGLGPIPQAQNSATTEPTEIKRYYYTNPNIGRKGRGEYIRFYEEDGHIKGDTYSTNWDEIIESDIDIYVSNWKGESQRLKDLNLRTGKAILGGINQDTSDIELNSFRHNGNVSIVTFV